MKAGKIPKRGALGLKPDVFRADTALEPAVRMIRRSEAVVAARRRLGRVWLIPETWHPWTSMR